MVSAEFVMGNCALCLQDRDLQLSHVIPNAFFRKIKKRKGAKSGHYISVNDVANIWQQESFEEKLLCRDCEQKFSNNFEQYGIDLTLHNPGKLGITVEKSEQTLTMSGIDYVKLKLFQLSILWRASVATNNFYSQIKLVPFEEERIRKILFNLENTDPIDFACIMSALCIGNNKLLKETKDLIVTPFTETIGIYSFYVFYFGGYEWRFTNPICDNKYKANYKIVSTDGHIKCLIKDVHSIPRLFKQALVGYKNQKENNGIDPEI